MGVGAGCHIPVRAVALLNMRDEKGDDETMVRVPWNDPIWSSITDLDLPSDRLRVEISHFFSIYKEPEGKPVAGGSRRRPRLARTRGRGRRHRAGTAALSAGAVSDPRDHGRGPTRPSGRRVDASGRSNA